jgi:GTP cyclohydrolase I
MPQVLIALGSNINSEYNLREAVRRLALRSRLIAVSPVYETEPVGAAGQPNFLNAAALLETDLSPAKLKSQVLEVIEQELGRVRTADKNAPRTIDLDLALVGDQVLDLGPRHIPDLDLTRHPHIAIPLADLAPKQRHPETGQTLQEIAESMPRKALLRRPEIVLWSRRGLDSRQERSGAMKVDPADFDVFRSDLLDIEDEPCTGDIECAMVDILVAIGEDPQREGLVRTPARIARMYKELTAGYHVDPARLLNDAIFHIGYDEMVIVRDIDFYSLCEHHMLPFLGQAHVAYIPDGTVIGLSKIPRIVEMFARRLQIQERMTEQIAAFLHETLNPLGVAVVVEGLHMCAAMRGVKKANARMVTSAMLGTFKENHASRAEFFDHIGRHAPGTWAK